MDDSDIKLIRRVKVISKDNAISVLAGWEKLPEEEKKMCYEHNDLIGRWENLVDEIDNAALCGLTVALAIGFVIPVTGNIREGIGVLNTMYEKLLHCELPKDDWHHLLEKIGA